MIICGYFNGRIGILQEAESEDLKKWSTIDGTINQNGRHLIDFLNENNLCILNGRLTPENDNFTSKGSGKAVVDYLITTTYKFPEFSEYRVHTVSDLLTAHNIQLLSDTKKVPVKSQSLLTCKLDTLHKETCTEAKSKSNINWGEAKIQIQTFTNEKCAHIWVWGKNHQTQPSIAKQAGTNSLTTHL